MTHSGQSLSLTRRLIIELSAVIGTVSLVGSVLFIFYVASVGKENLEARADQTLKHVAKVLEKPLWDFDVDAVKSIGESFALESDNAGFRCTGQQGEELYAFRRGSIEDSVWRHAAIVHNGITLGEVDIYVGRRQFNESFWRVVQTAALLNALVLLTVVLTAGLIVRTQLRKPLDRLAQLVQGYTEHERLPETAPIPYVEFKPFESVLLAMGRRIGSQLNDLRSLSSQLEARNTELLEVNQLQQMIFDQALHFIGVLSPDGRVLRANRTALAFAGVEECAVLGKPFWDTPWWLPGDDHQKVLREAIRRAAEGDVARFETTNVDAEGALHAVDFSVKPVLNSVGEIVYLIAEGRNITEILRAKAALREVEERYRILYENAGDAIVIMQDNVFVDCNEKALEVFGCTRDQLVGETPYRFSPPFQADGEDSIQKGQAKTALAREGKAQSFEWLHTRRDGTPFDAEISLNAIRVNEEVFLQAIVRDISERKRTEQQHENLQSQLRQAQKLEAIGTLAGGIAHDFNNILGAIIGHTQLLQFSAEQGKAPDGASLEEILHASNRARDLVRQILTFSQRSKPTKQPLRLDLIVKEVLKLLRGALPVIVDIRLDIEPSRGAILADATHMHQVVMNLCTNAAHAIGERPGVLRVGLRNVELTEEDATAISALPAGAYLKLTVSDTGCGIAPENMERIFDPFFTTKGPGEGTGLGLAVVHGIVQDHGGAITVKSEVGAGTEFCILLPLMNAAIEGARPARNLTDLPRGQERILVVDDEEPLLQVASQMLISLGYEVVVRNRAVQAFDLIVAEREHFDLVITDLMMPEMTGIELRRRLSEENAGVLMLLATGYSDKISLDRARELGFADVLRKPLGFSELALNVRRVLDEE